MSNTAEARLVLRGRDETQRAFRGVQRGMGDLRRSAKVAATAVAGLGTALAFAAVKAVGTADELAKTIRQTGFAGDEYQALAFQAQQFGVVNDTLSASLQAFTRRLGQAADGTGQASKQYEALGIEIRNTDGTMRSSGEVLRDVADALKGIESPAERAAIAADLFSRRGLRMADVLSGGSAELDRFKVEAEALGVILSDSVLRRSEEAADQLGIMSRVIKVQAIDALSNLFPLITEVGNSFQGASVAVRNFFDAFDERSELRRFGRIAEINEEIESLQDRLEKKRRGGRGALRIREELRAQIDELTAEREALEQAIADQRASQQEAANRRQELLSGATTPDLDGAADESGDGETAAERAAARELDAIRNMVKTREQILREAAERRKQIVEDNVENELDRQQLLIAIETDLVEQLHGIREESRKEEEKRADDHSQRIGDTLSDGLTAGMTEGASGVKRVFERMLQDLAAQMIRSQVFSMLGNLGGGGFLGGFAKSFASSLLGGGGDSLSTIDTAALPKRIQGFARGTHFAPGGLAVVGERGPELANIPRGTAITPNDKLGGTQIVNIIDQRQAAAPPVQVERSQSGGVEQIRIFIRDEVKSAIAEGGMDRELQNTGMVGRRRGSR